MLRFFRKNILLLGLALIAGWFALPVQAAANPSPDAIAIRVMPNTEHLSPLSWYNGNVNIKGAPQSLIVDGYEAVRDGRTVYVSAANLSDETDNATIYTNIYIISYNQEAETATQDIFGQILNYWQFNTELIDRTGSGVCRPSSQQSCDGTTPCSGQFADYACENNICVKHCLLSSDCPNNQYCSSRKAQLIRDVKRMADLRQARLALNAYRDKNKKFPNLPSGSYLPDKTISVWPSWNETLGKKLGYSLPLDPVNRLGACPGFDPITCWDENTKKFATNLKNPTVFPPGSLAFFYEYNAKSDQYRLCANFETPFQGLPEEHRCDQYVNAVSETAPAIILGSFRSKSGQPFKDYFTVQSQYPLDWDTLTLSADWADWYNRGWRWDYNYNQLNVQKVPNGDEDTRSISARAVNLTGNKTYDTFNVTFSIKDVLGHTGSVNGQIKICNPVTCQGRGAECGRLDDGCGGVLLCGECQPPLDCMDNKCVNQQ